MSAQDLTAAELPRRVPAVRRIFTCALPGSRRDSSRRRCSSVFAVSGSGEARRRDPDRGRGGRRPDAAGREGAPGGKERAARERAGRLRRRWTAVLDPPRRARREPRLGNRRQAAENEGRGSRSSRASAGSSSPSSGPRSTRRSTRTTPRGRLRARTGRGKRRPAGSRSALARRGLHFTPAPGPRRDSRSTEALRRRRSSRRLRVSTDGPGRAPDGGRGTRGERAAARGAARARERIVSAPVTLASARRVRLEPARARVDAQRRGRPGRRARARRPAADAYFAHLQATVDHAARERASPSSGVACSRHPGTARERARHSAGGRRCSPPPSDTGRVARSPSTRSSRPGRRRRRGHGDHRSRQQLRDGVRRGANRIHNVELVAHLIDGKLIAPGATFSFNRATGARTLRRASSTAPVIINGEVSSGLGGGVCQVSTTVFNAAFMAGLPITARTNHALYISHYPLGRDATVDYPDIDLRFVNDTEHWLLLRTDVGSLARRLALRHAAAPPRRDGNRTARATGRMPIAPRLDRSLAPGVRRDLLGAAGAVDLGTASRLRPGRQAPLRRDLVLELPRGAGSRPRGAEAAQAGRSQTASGRLAPFRRAVSPVGFSPRARRTQSGVRQGRRVRASTVPCAVQPSARRVSSRSTAYSKRKRAPRTSTQRACTARRSSKTAGAWKRTCASRTSDSTPSSRTRW